MASVKNQIGLGLRTSHYSTIENEKPAIDFFEALSDNYFGGGSPLFHLNRIRHSYPISLHGVGMSLGSTDSLNFEYLNQLKKLIEHVQPFMVSDHLCWTSFNNQYFHELLPLPYTEEAAKHVINRIQQVQDFLQRPIAIENVTTYLSFQHSTLAEWDFLNFIAKNAGCFILADINNIFVSSFNNNFDPFTYINKLDPKNILQIHLAGFTDKKTYLIDTHGTPIDDRVWELYRYAIQCWGSIPTIIEWDNDIPDFHTLLKEALRAKHIMSNDLNTVISV